MSHKSTESKDSDSSRSAAGRSAGIGPATKVVVKPAQPDWAQVLSDCAQTSKAHWGYPENWLQEWKKELTVTSEYVRSHPVFCLMVGEEIAGFYAITHKAGDVELDHFWLLSKWIGSGLGRQLFDHVIMNARQQKARKILIVSDPNALGFYQHLGATQIGWQKADVAGEPRQLPVLEVRLD